MLRQLKNKVLLHAQTLAKRVHPTSLIVEPTNRCNVNCVVCQRRDLTRPIGDLSLDRFQTIVDSIPTVKRIALYFMGEPFLNPDLIAMVNYASRRGIRCTVATNSSLIGEYVPEILASGLDTLILSLDGMSQDSLAQYRRGADFHKTVAGIEDFLLERRKRGRSKPTTWIRFLVFRHNEHEIEEVKEFAQSHGIRVDLVRPILDWGYNCLPDDRRDLMSTISTYQRYNDDGSLRNPSSECGYLFKPVITWDGQVVPCCFDVNADYSIGNLFETPFHEIFWSARYRALRLRMWQNDLPLCRFCKHIEEPVVTIHPRT